MTLADADAPRFVADRAAVSDPAPTAVARVTARVRAGVTLRTSNGVVRNGTALRFSGRVLGERGTRRALVTIYALAGGPRQRIRRDHAGGGRRAVS